MSVRQTLQSSPSKTIFGRLKITSDGRTDVHDLSKRYAVASKKKGGKQGRKQKGSEEEREKG